MAIWVIILVQPEYVDAQDSLDQRPKIGLVLGGGGAKGAAHIGVLKVLEENRIPVDFIAGSSMGSIIAGLYAAGLSASEIEQRLNSIDWNDVMKDKPPRQLMSFRRKQDDNNYLMKFELGIKDGGIAVPKGLIIGQKFNFLLHWFTLHTNHISDFDQLPIPFRAVAVDMANGEMVAIDGGSLADAIRASAALPGIFAPVEVNGRLLIDGAMAKNLPIDVVRNMGADIIIAVDVGTKFASVEEIKSALDISSQAMLMMSRISSDQQIATLGKRDILINPEVNHIGTLEFEKSQEAIQLGQTATRQWVDKLAKISVTPTEYDLFVKKHRIPQDKSIMIDKVELRNKSMVSDRAIWARISAKPGDVLDHNKLKRDIDKIYGMGDFEEVGFEVLRENGENKLIYETIGKSWGPTYLRFGLNIEDNFSGENNYSLLASVNKTQINSLGAEWKTNLKIGNEQLVETEFFQPLEYSGRYFIIPSIAYKRHYPTVYFDQDQVDYDVTQTDISVLFGYQIGPHYGAIVAGPVTSWIRADPSVSSLDFPHLDVQQAGLYGGFGYDQLDSVHFPHDGERGTVEYYALRESWGSDLNYDKLEVTFSQVNSIRAHSFMYGLTYSTGLDSDIPVYDRFALGGFLNLSGLNRNEIEGPHAGLARFVYYNQISRLPGIVGDGIYVGGSLEAGNVWQDTKDIDINNVIVAASVFFGLDSLLGPVYLAYGHAESGRNSLYLFLGPIF